MLIGFFRIGIVVILVNLLTSCGWFSDQSKDYLQAQSAPNLTVPKQLSNSKVKDTYPIPRGNLWQSNQPISIYPPGSSLEKQAKAKQAQQPVNRYQMGVGPDGEAALLVLEPFNQVWALLPSALTEHNHYVINQSIASSGIIDFHADKTAYRLNVIRYTLQQTVLILQTANGGFVEETQAKEILSQINYGLIDAAK